MDDRNDMPLSGVRAWLVSHGFDQPTADRVIDSYLELRISSHRLELSLPTQELDALKLKEQQAARAMKVIALAEPFVKFQQMEGETNARFDLRFPEGPEFLGASHSECVALQLGIARTNALLQRGVLRAAEGGLLAFGPAAPKILAIQVDSFWWGTCICLDHDEVLALEALLVVASLGLALIPGVDLVAATASLLGGAVVGLLESGSLTLDFLFSLVSSRLKSSGLCIYNTPMGTFIVPWIQ